MDAGRPSMLALLAGRVRAAPYAALAAAVLAAAAYLCLVNLDYAALWHDEAPTAMIGRNLLQRGDITGWDGRNLVGGTNGRTLNERLQDVLPPLMYAVNAASFGLFGVSESAARLAPALFGIASLALLYLLLRQHLANHPRLILFALALAAWSPQLLLYYRQSRYFAVMAFALIAAFYLYERWWRTGRIRWLAALTLVAALAFFNHYAGGAATMLALAAWHLLFRTRATAPRPLHEQRLHDQQQRQRPHVVAQVRERVDQRPDRLRRQRRREQREQRAHEHDPARRRQRQIVAAVRPRCA
jgi:predicted membrane-bound mannosyltransferase